MSMMMVSFSAAGIQIANILGVNVNLVNMCMGVYIFASVFSIPGNYINDKYGFHVGVGPISDALAIHCHAAISGRRVAPHVY